MKKRSRHPPHYFLTDRLAQLRDPIPTRPLQPNGGRTMRRWFLATWATLFAAAAMAPAGALPLGPAAMRPAVEAITPVEQTACWRRGLRGWGWYPCWGWYGSSYYYRHW